MSFLLQYTTPYLPWSRAEFQSLWGESLLRTFVCKRKETKIPETGKIVGSLSLYRKAQGQPS